MPKKPEGNDFYLGSPESALAFEKVAMEMRVLGESAPIHNRFYELVMGSAIQGDPSFAQVAAQRVLVAISQSNLNPAYKTFAMYAMHGLVRSPHLCRELFNPGIGAGAPKQQLGAFLAARRIFSVVTKEKARTVEDAIAKVAAECHKSESLIAKHWTRFKADVFALESALEGVDAEGKFFACLKASRER